MTGSGAGVRGDIPSGRVDVAAAVVSIMMAGPVGQVAPRSCRAAALWYDVQIIIGAEKDFGAAGKALSRCKDPVALIPLEHTEAGHFVALEIPDVIIYSRRGPSAACSGVNDTWKS
jgi:hypothetical protein